MSQAGKLMRTPEEQRKIKASKSYLCIWPCIHYLLCPWSYMSKSSSIRCTYRVSPNRKVEPKQSRRSAENQLFFEPRPSPVLSRQPPSTRVRRSTFISSSPVHLGLAPGLSTRDMYVKPSSIRDTTQGLVARDLVVTWSEGTDAWLHTRLTRPDVIPNLTAMTYKQSGYRYQSR
jgi:hypothetical protein